jgi:hypothetical protein
MRMLLLVFSWFLLWCHPHLSLFVDATSEVFAEDRVRFEERKLIIDTLEANKVPSECRIDGRW